MHPSQLKGGLQAKLTMHPNSLAHHRILRIQAQVEEKMGQRADLLDGDLQILYIEQVSVAGSFDKSGWILASKTMHSL